MYFPATLFPDICKYLKYYVWKELDLFAFGNIKNTG